MARWRAIQHAGLTLTRLLQARADVEGLAVTVQLASTQSFQHLTGTRGSTITVLLYRVTENSEMRNSPRRILPGGSSTRAPLVLELCYLITPWGARRAATLEADTAAAEEEAALLGLIMQTLHDHTELTRSELFDGVPPLPVPPIWHDIDSAQLVLESLSLEDQYRIWDSGEQPYRPSATYRMRIVGLDALELRQDAPVRDAAMVIGRIP